MSKETEITMSDGTKYIVEEYPENVLLHIQQNDHNREGFGVYDGTHGFPRPKIMVRFSHIVGIKGLP